MPTTQNQYNTVLYRCDTVWNTIFNDGNGDIVFVPDGTIYAEISNGNGTFSPYKITKVCCDVLKNKLITQNPPQYPSNVNPNNIYFDLDEQKCRWSETPSSSCLTNQPIKIVLNPVGNDGAFFTLTENDTCRLEVSFDYLFKIKCSHLGDVLTPNGGSGLVTYLRQNNFAKESELLDINNELESLSKQAANISYSITCNDFPTTEEVVTATPTTDITPVQKLPFINTGFGSLTNETQITTSKTKVAPVYETKSVNFCLTDAGLNAWRLILGDNNYNEFINGNPDSYSCLDVIEIDKQNQESVITNGEKLIFECETPFGEKTNLLNKISELAGVQKSIRADIIIIDDDITGIGGVVDPCSSLIGQFENISASASVDLIDENNVITQIHIDNFFPTHANLYQYLTQTQDNSGFFVCGDPSTTETWTSGCTGLVYPEFTYYGVIENSENLNVSICKGVKDALQQELFNSSNIATLNGFNSSLSSNVFNSNWLTHNFTISDQRIISGMTNNQIKLNIIINSSCDNFCLLIDQINMTKVCDDANRTNIFISESPGFEITRIIDNKKSWLQAENTTDRNFFVANYDDSNKIRQTEYTVDEDRLILNSKEIDLTMNMASAVENDVWCYLVDNPNLLTGSTNPSPCTPSCGDNMINISGLTTLEISEIKTLETFENSLISQLTDVKNRKILSAYPTLRALYDRYMDTSLYGVPDSNEFDYQKMDKFTGLIKTYWDDLIEQVVPATTLWGSVKVYTNTMFDQQTFKYRSYTSLFCDEPKNRFRVPFNVPSPINGNDGLCQNVEAVLSYLPTEDSLIIANTSTYNKICLSQMNYGSEFIGNVDIIGPKGQDINSDNFCGPCIPEFTYNNEFYGNLLIRNGHSFSSDGTLLFITVHNNGMGSGAPDTVRAYSLFTPWDVSTINPSTPIAQSISMNQSGTTAVYGHHFSPNGQYLFVCGSNSNLIIRYELTTFWNVSTTTFTNGNTYNTVSSPSYIDFTPNGLFMFVVEGSNIKRYTLTIAWDITSGVSETQSLPNGSGFDLSFQNDGYYLFSLNSVSTNIVLTKRTLSTPYDLTSITSTETIVLNSILIPLGNFYGLSFKDGYKGFISVYTTTFPNKIYAFELGCEYDIQGPLVINPI